MKQQSVCVTYVKMPWR